MSDRESGERPQRASLTSFHELMQHRVQRILLVSSLYDSFIMSEDGHLQESLLNQFLALNLGNFPDLVQVSNSTEALRALDQGKGFDVVISSVQAGDVSAAELARRIKADGYTTPVIALAYTGKELREFLENEDTSALERIFLWQGDVQILLAMVKYLEDRLNVSNDTTVRGVPVVIVVEDNIRYYSSFLPAIYSEIYQHTHRVLAEGLNLSQKMMRMRARPKVLLCNTFEEAVEAYEKYGEQVLGVVSDFEFPRQGKLDPQAGLALAKMVLATRSDVRLVLQSSVAENGLLAEQIGASFLLKGSPVLLQQLRSILVERFGFGDFIFRTSDGREIDRAKDLKDLAKKLETVPVESLAYHAERNHFANWLKARTEFALAEKLRPKKVSDFESAEHLRAHLLSMVHNSQLEKQRTVIADFDKATFDPDVSFTRIGAGSLGGKARGLAFANRILHDSDIQSDFPDVEIYVPPSVVLGTEIFEAFLTDPRLHEFAIADNPDEEIVQRFIEAPFPRKFIANLNAFLERARYPIAVRSSSLLEDSLSQPFAGVYRTFMLANNQLDQQVRFRQLGAAIKRVYASAFSRQAKNYLEMTAYRLEEERMGAMVQQLVGEVHADRFYPDFAGVARSHNFYPEPGRSAADGVAAVALGMGRTVVEGNPCLRFCPKAPRQTMGFSSVKDALESSQRDFWALDLNRELSEPGLGLMQHLPLEIAEQDGSLAWLGSTYCAEDDRIVDGIARAGVRLVSFAQILKHEAFPLAPILSELLERCSQGMGGPVELEFAGNLAKEGRRARFAFLQMRPLALAKEGEAVAIGELEPSQILCRSRKVLGNGRIEDLVDIVAVDVERFERAKSPEAALQVAKLDATLRNEGRPYLLVGVGRWGSADPSLGIPVQWPQIAGARVIVEAGFEDIHVEPSQGTHFFQNLTSSNVGYFTVNPGHDEGLLDWGWLGSLSAQSEANAVRHLRLQAPLLVKMNGRTGEGVILKPQA